MLQRKQARMMDSLKSKLRDRIFSMAGASLAKQNAKSSDDENVNDRQLSVFGGGNQKSGLKSETGGLANSASDPDEDFKELDKEILGHQTSIGGSINVNPLSKTVDEKAAKPGLSLGLSSSKGKGGGMSANFGSALLGKFGGGAAAS